MIQFNLLPDVKQQYIKAKRMKRTAIVVSFLVAASSFFIFIMLFLSVNVFQKDTIKDVNEDIKTSSKKLQGTPDIDKILTIQNQLKSLPGLHAQKVSTSRLSKYLTQVTPENITIGDIEVDYELKTIKIVGSSDSLQTVNKFVDTLKFTTYNVNADDGNLTVEKAKPFSSVVLSNFTRKSNETTYEITFAFDTIIFDNTKNVSLVVPKITTTRSELEKPKELFKAIPEEERQ